MLSNDPNTSQAIKQIVIVGGGTAGRFGAAVELIRVWVADGSEWCVRATASKSAWPRVRGELRRAVDSFEFA